MNQWTNEQMNKWTNEQMNQWTNEMKPKRFNPILATNTNDKIDIFSTVMADQGTSAQVVVYNEAKHGWKFNSSEH